MRRLLRARRPGLHQREWLHFEILCVRSRVPTCLAHSKTLLTMIKKEVAETNESAEYVEGARATDCPEPLMGSWALNWPLPNTVLAYVSVQTVSKASIPQSMCKST